MQDTCLAPVGQRLRQVHGHERPGALVGWLVLDPHDLGAWVSLDCRRDLVGRHGCKLLDSQDRGRGIGALGALGLQVVNHLA